jgi:hypothetical protein
VKAEVVALTEIPYVKGARARLLYKAGLRTPEAVAAVDLERLVEILATGAPAAGKGASEEQQRRAEQRAARMILEGAWLRRLLGPGRVHSVAWALTPLPSRLAVGQSSTAPCSRLLLLPKAGMCSC